jgi:hypothetical protein
VDVFEVILVLTLLVGLPLVTMNMRQSWDEKEWAIDSADPSFRRLGVSRFENARLLFGAMSFLAIGALGALLVPSPTLQLTAPGVEFIDIFNAIIQRLVPAGVALCLAYKAWNDIIWRRYVDSRRRTSSIARAAADAQKSVATDAVGLAETESVTETESVAEAPVVVVPSDPPPSQTQTLKQYRGPEAPGAPGAPEAPGSP